MLKCAHQDAGAACAAGLPAVVAGLLAADPDAQVAANCLYVLKELGGLREALTRPVVASLLNRVREMSDWALCALLEALTEHHRPASEAERFAVLDALDFALGHANTAVALGAAKLFLHATAAYPEQYARVLAAVAPALAAAAGAREPEVAYAALANALALARRHPAAFASLQPELLCRPEDPPPLKVLKLEALVATAAPASAYDAAEEAAQYARDADEGVARAAVRSIALIALRAPGVDGVLDRLLLFLGAPRPAVAAEALAALADAARRFPAAADALAPALAEAEGAAAAAPAARAARAWVLGAFGDRLQDAPYLLEDAIAGFAAEPAPEVRLALLAAAARLFFARPPEARAALGAALAAGAADADARVRARAARYHALLQGDAAVAKSILAPALPAPAPPEDAASPELRDRLFAEWNTLSVIYRAPAATFIDAGGGAAALTGEEGALGAGGEGLGDAELGGGGGGGGGGSEAAPLLDLGGEAEGGGGGGGASPARGSAGDFSVGGAGAAAAPPPVGAVAAPPPADALADFLGEMAAPSSSSAAASPAPAAAAAAPAGLGGLDDLLGDFTSAAPAAAPAAFSSTAAPVELDPASEISAAEFAAQWAALAGGALAVEAPLGAGALAAASAPRALAEHLAQARLAVLAAPRPGAPPPLRFLVHARRAGGGGARVLAEVRLAAGGAAAAVASADAAAAAHVADALRALLAAL